MHIPINISGKNRNNKITNDFLTYGIIIQSNSSYCAKVVHVKKNNLHRNVSTS